MAAIPQQIGEWQGTDIEGSDEKVRKIAGAEGELIRTYKNANGDEVRISLICGRLRDITFHTPDRCYPAAGFEMQGDPHREVFELPGNSAEFFTTSFLKSEPSGTHAERGYWSWTGDGKWVAPDNTKYAFAHQQRALYKLYVFGNVPVGAKQQANQEDPCQSFIRAFLPALDQALRPAYESVGRISTDGAIEKPAAEKPIANPAS